jgi:hypothetical protein
VKVAIDRAVVLDFDLAIGGRKGGRHGENGSTRGEGGKTFPRRWLGEGEQVTQSV